MCRETKLISSSVLCREVLIIILYPYHGYSWIKDLTPVHKLILIYRYLFASNM